MKNEINKLKNDIEELKNRDIIQIEKIYEMKEREYQARLEFERKKYNTIVERKKEVIELCKAMEQHIKSEINSLIGIDISQDVDNYMKLLKFLKEG